MPLTRVVLADDNESFRGALKAILSLQPDVEVVAEAVSGREAFRQVIELRPDVLVLDIRLPDYDGLEVMRQLREAGDQTRVVILSLWDNAEYRRTAAKQGAAAYVVKGAAFTQLLPVIRGEEPSGTSS
jgi:DNA-binding NarL/FixJ family response regulator